jgi:hypothetical protein
VTVLLAPSEKAPAASTHYAAAHQEGLPRLQNPQRLLDDADIGTAINPRQAQSTGLSMSEADAAPRSPTVAAVASPDAEYLRRWQDRIERFGNAYYRGLALQHGDGDVRLRVIIAANGRCSALTYYRALALRPWIKRRYTLLRSWPRMLRFLQRLPAQLLSWLSSAHGNFGGNITE